MLKIFSERLHEENLFYRIRAGILLWISGIPGLLANVLFNPYIHK